MTRKRIFQLLFLALLVGGTVFIACQQHAPYQRASGFIFGTMYNVTYQHRSDLQADIEAELLKVDGEFSMFNEHSTVAAINRGEQPQLSPMYKEVYQLAQRVNADTYGAFDITVAPLVNAWGFGFKSQQLPTPEQVDSLLRIRSMLDFSAIAKGYGCDVVARLLQAHGIENYLVEIGGEVVAQGVSDQGRPWRIGVSKPTDDPAAQAELQAVLTVDRQAMATSGNYRNYYIADDGRKYAHTIDPRTGYPVQHNILSATVLAPTCAQADAYATAFMVLGLDSARIVLSRHADMQAYIVYTDSAGHYATWHSPALHVEEAAQPEEQ